MKKVRLADLAEVIRSKNAGPFELTFDLIFPDRETFDLVRSAGVITRDLVARMYGVPLHKVLCLVDVPQANAFKATIARPVPSGCVGDTDVYGAQQHAPWLDVEIPLPESQDDEIEEEDHHNPHPLAGEDDAKGQTGGVQGGVAGEVEAEAPERGANGIAQEHGEHRLLGGDDSSL